MLKTFIILSGVALWWVAAEIGPYSYATDETHHHLTNHSKLPTINYNTSSANISLSRDHVTVFFDNRVRYHTHEAENAYTKAELAAMVSVVSRRFSKLLIDTAPKLPSLPPNETAPSRVWIPSVVAQHNLKHSSKSPMEVIVSFEFDIDIYSDQEAILHHETSFDVAKHMADTANNIFPGTVKTLMMTMYRNEKLEYAEESHDYTYWQYIQDWHNEDEFELVYLDHVYHTVWPYHLGIFMDIHDCGRFRGHLPHKVKEILGYMSTVALFIDPSTFHHLTTLSAQETHKMFVAKFEDCERKLKEANSEVKVIPSTLWKSHHITIASMVEDWQMKNAWAVENNKEILMYEAFDTPGGRDFYYWGHGWWRLKDRSAFTINETSFVEKIEDSNSKIYRQDLYSSGEFSSSSEEVVIDTSNSKTDTTNCTQASSNATAIHIIPPPAPATHSDQVIQYPPPPPSTTTVIHSSSTNHAVYIVLVILSVICAILVASQVYFHSRVINSSNGQPLKVRSIVRSKGSQHHCFSNPGLPGSLEDVSTTGLVNPHACTSNGHDNHIINGVINLNDDDGDVGIMNGNAMEMSDTSPIVSVSYKKM